MHNRNISKLIIFNFKNKIIIWDMSKWNRGQTNWYMWQVNKWFILTSKIKLISVPEEVKTLV